MNDVQNILKLITQFIEKEINILPIEVRKNSVLVHYYSEIIRFWNKLNFITKKNLNITVKNNELSKYVYATYRMLWEKASEKVITKELKGIDRSFLKKLKIFSLKQALINRNELEKFSISEAIPSFMIQQLLPVMDRDFLKKNVRFMNGLDKDIRITLRINNLCVTPNSESLPIQIRKNFKKNNIDFQEDFDIPELVWIPLLQKNRVIRNSFYQKGNLIFQDKASVAVIQALLPKSEEKVCDMCAAPGIKTSLIAQYMNNKGQIIAGEFLPKRVTMMKLLLKELNVLNVHILNTDSIILPVRFQNYFDKILLDAPCTGSGTFLTSPELKWRQNEKFLHQNVLLQEKLLKSAINLLKPSGILIYSTCSLYPEEGEYQIKKFLDNLEPMNLPNWMDKSYKIDGNIIPGTARLFPAKHHTEGFFIAKFKKK